MVYCESRRARSHRAAAGSSPWLKARMADDRKYDDLHQQLGHPRDVRSLAHVSVQLNVT